MAFQSTCRIPLIALILSSIAVQAASAKTYVVNPDGSGDFPNIQEAVAASVDDDEIQLGNGTFVGQFNRDVILINKRITIRSQSDDPTQCIIDCDAQTRGLDARAFSNSTSDPSGPLIRGITIQGGFGGLGGAIVTNGSLRLENCKFLENESNVGGAIYLFQPDPPAKLGGRTVVIDGCDFISNFADTEGGAIAHLDSTTEVIISNSRFMKNVSAGFGGAIFAITPFVIDDTIFARNEARDTGGAIVCVNGGSFSGCTLALNRAPIGSGIFYGSPLDSPLRGAGISLSVANSIIAFGEGGQPVSCEDTALIVFSCCDVYGNAAGDWVGCLTGLDKANGNISENPLFCGLESADLQLFGDRFTLSPESPCLPTKGGCALIGARGLEECVAIPTKSALEETTWGQVKAAYR